MNREEKLEALVDWVVEHMDSKDLVTYAYEKIREEYLTLGWEEIEAEYKAYLGEG